MRRISSITPSVLIVGAALIAAYPLGVLADGNEVLGQPSIPIEQGTGVVHAGTGLASGPGEININVPTGSTIEQVLLYWAGRGDGGATITIGDNVVTGLAIGGDGNPSRSYRADITHLDLVKNGANELSVQAPGFSLEDDGAGVLVVLGDGSGGLSGFAGETLLVDGNDFAFHKETTDDLKMTRPRTFNFAPANVERTAELRLFVADAIASRPDIIRVTVDGKTTTLVDRLASTDGSQWDSLTIPVTIPVGISQIKIQLFSERASNSELTGSPDSLAWVMANLTVPAEQGNMFSGRATVVRASALGLVNATVADTGSLPSSGGSIMKSTVDIDIGSLLSAELLTASTVGGGNQANSEASVANVKLNLSVKDDLPEVGALPVLGKLTDPVLSGDLGGLASVPLIKHLPLVERLLSLVGGLLGDSLTLTEAVGDFGISISAKVLEAETQAQCAVGAASVAGESVITDLALNIGGLDVNVDVTGEPNQTIDVLGLIKIIINEQVKSVGGNKGDITVNALHVIVSDAVLDLVQDPEDLVDVVVSSAHSDISCSTSGGHNGGGNNGGGNNGGGNNGGGNNGGGNNGGGDNGGGDNSGGGGGALGPFALLMLLSRLLIRKARFTKA